MLSKYNLNVGQNWYKVKMDIETGTVTKGNEYNATDPSAECIRIANENNGTWWDYFNEEDGYYCVYYVDTDYTDVKQDEVAIGAHGDVSGKPAFPEMAVVSLDSYPFDTFSSSYGGGYYKDATAYVTSADFYKYLAGYKTFLTNQGLTVGDVDVLALSDIDNIVYKATNARLPLEQWYNEWEYSERGELTGHYIIGSLKDKLNGKYPWLYSTTYWTKTAATGDSPSKISEDTKMIKTVQKYGKQGYTYDDWVFFIDTLGNVCSGYYCYQALGAGVRPVVTISQDDIIYNIVTKTDGNGTVVASASTARGDENITFIVTPNKGYKLDYIAVTDDNGNTIIFEDYKFTMPNANVTIEAKFVAENPDTVDNIGLYIAMFGIGAALMGLVIAKKKLEN